ncbi:hypothetical protein N9166_00045 [bacterium]|nr:hypothetical protein [bacterium]
MSNREIAVRLCREGCTPTEVADRMSAHPRKVREYFLTQIAEGDVKRSEILLSFDSGTREEYEKHISSQDSQEYWDLANSSGRAGIDEDVFRLYLEVRGCERGDLYEYLADIELSLHDFVRRLLKEEFGEHERGSWRAGVPETIRESCVTARERDPDPIDDPFAYTNFIHLATIIEKNWKIFAPNLPAQLRGDRKLFLDDLRRLNSIRNAVMHPAKKVPFEEDHLRFVQRFHSALTTLEPRDRGVDG